MKTRYVLMLAAGLCAASLLFTAHDAKAVTDRTLSGELVVLDASAHRFRIVGQSGSFTAPAGTTVEALDGHPVEVELSSHGTVTQITDVHVPIQPVTHGWSTAQGQLVVTDAAARRFTFIGDGQTYVAPPATDVAAYAGKMVEITLDEDGRVTAFRLVASPQTSLSPRRGRRLAATVVRPIPPALRSVSRVRGTAVTAARGRALAWGAETDGARVPQPCCRARAWSAAPPSRAARAYAAMALPFAATTGRGSTSRPPAADRSDSRSAFRIDPTQIT